jgi:hypothetical protein
VKGVNEKIGVLHRRLPLEKPPAEKKAPPMLPSGLSGAEF